MLVNFNLISFDTLGSHRFDSDVVFDEKKRRKMLFEKKRETSMVIS